MHCAHGLKRFREWSIPLLFAGFLIASLMYIGGCHHEKGPLFPPGDTTTPTGWRMVLQAPSILYRDRPGGHVENDTIMVRLYRPTGELASGIAIRCQALISDSVTRYCQSRSDTVTCWWGSEPAIFYWGTGGADGMETIHAWAVVGSDSVAHTAVSFKVRDP